MEKGEAVKTLSFFSILYFIFGYAFDEFVSYLSYLKDSTFFVKYEYNVEIVRAFTAGEVPLAHILGFLIPAISFYYVYDYNKKNDTGKSLLLLFMICIILIVIGTLKFNGGLTWFRAGVLP